MRKCTAKGATRYLCQKEDHFERTPRPNLAAEKDNQSGYFKDRRIKISMCRKAGRITFHNMSVRWDGSIFRHDDSIHGIRAVSARIRADSWDSGDYLFMSIRSKNKTELRVAGAKSPIAKYGKKTSVWVDSGSPISIFRIGELKKTLSATGVNLRELTSEKQDF